jgi:DNA anti-recombination protein RmuC
MERIKEELNNLGKEIDKAKSNLSQLQGRREEVIKRCVEQFATGSITEIDKMINTLQETSTSFEEEIPKLFEELKKEFQW